MILDAHLHIGVWDLEKFYGLKSDVPETEEILESCGIAGGIVTTSDQRRNQGLLKELLRLGKKRYWFFPWVHPGDQDDFPFLVQSLELVAGLKFHPALSQRPVTDQGYEPYFQFAEQRGLPVLIHCGRWQEVSGYRFALERAKAYPRLKFILAHLGGDGPDLKMESVRAVQDENLDNIWFSIEGTREYWALDKGIEALGIDRFLFGSDFPIEHPRMYLGLVDALGLSGPERDKLLGGNLAALLDPGKCLVRPT
jgi:predicted TIM-barrel fold metal-dependent hydrolase